MWPISCVSTDSTSCGPEIDVKASEPETSQREFSPFSAMSA